MEYWMLPSKFKWEKQLSTLEKKKYQSKGTIQGNKIQFTMEFLPGTRKSSTPL